MSVTVLGRRASTGPANNPAKALARKNDTKVVFDALEKKTC